MWFSFVLLTTSVIASLYSYPVYVSETNYSSFLSVGDWGAAMIGGQHEVNVQSVSQRMQQEQEAEFVLNTGDNFYYCGIESIHDSQINVDFVDTFGRMNKTWYNTLGNHDYGYNVSAQIDLSNVIPQWRMDSRYFSTSIPVKQSNVRLHLISLDTSPCVQDYRNDNPDYWDPCGSEYPTCSLNDTNDDFEGECKFHQNILTQNCSVQYEWLQTTIESIHELKQSSFVPVWIIVIGHHPIYEINVEPFVAFVDAYADLYLNGHTHLLNHYNVNHKDKYVTTGAGGMVSTASDTTVEHSEPAFPNIIPHEVAWTQKVAGYTRHTFSTDGMSLTTEFIDWRGNELYSFTVFQ